MNCEHIVSVDVPMRINSNWRKFELLLDRALPKYGETIKMYFPEDGEAEL